MPPPPVYRAGSVLRAAADAAAALPTPTDRAHAITAAAVRTRAILVPGFLTAAEIAEVDGLWASVRAEEAARSGGGTAELFNHPNLVGLRASNHHWAFLHVERLIDKRLPHILEKVVSLMRQVDADQGWGLLGEAGKHNVRTCEYHEYTEGGEVSPHTHADGGSLVTSSVLLVDSAGGFTGGGFTTLEADEETVMEWPEFSRAGDALVFVSEKWHSVDAVESGKRTSLVTELWGGARCLHDRDL